VKVRFLDRGFIFTRFFPDAAADDGRKLGGFVEIIINRHRCQKGGQTGGVAVLLGFKRHHGIFDPGQGLPMFDGDDLKRFVLQATWVAVNDYEGRMLCDRTGQTLESLSRSHLKGVIVTLGAEGCDLWQQGVRTHVAGVAASEIVDPTGCGDAFRGALLFGLERGWSLERCVALGNKIGALKIASRGGQNHTFDAAALTA